MNRDWSPDNLNFRLRNILWTLKRYFFFIFPHRTWVDLCYTPLSSICIGRYNGMIISANPINFLYVSGLSVSNECISCPYIVWCLSNRKTILFMWVEKSTYLNIRKPSAWPLSILIEFKRNDFVKECLCSICWVP